MKIKEMVQPQMPPDNNIYTVIEVASVCATFIVAVWKWIDSYFKSLKESKQEFIQNVVVATVKATLDSELKSVREDVKKLFEYREADRTHIDDKFGKLMAEIKK